MQYIVPCAKQVYKRLEYFLVYHFFLLSAVLQDGLYCCRSKALKLTVDRLKSEVDHLRLQLHYADEVSYNERFVWVINEVLERTTVIHQSDLTKGHTILCIRSALFYTSRFGFFFNYKKTTMFYLLCSLYTDSDTRWD